MLTGNLVRKTGTEIVDLTWPLVDDAVMATALATPEPIARMVAVSEAIESIIPLPEDSLAKAAVQSAIRTAISIRLFGNDN